MCGDVMVKWISLFRLIGVGLRVVRIFLCKVLFGFLGLGVDIWLGFSRFWLKGRIGFKCLERVFRILVVEVVSIVFWWISLLVFFECGLSGELGIVNILWFCFRVNWVVCRDLECLVVLIMIILSDIFEISWFWCGKFWLCGF